MGEHADRLCRTQRRSKNGSKMQVDLPLVSSCVFVRIRRGDRVKVLDIPGVLSLVGAKSSQSNRMRNMQIEARSVGLDQACGAASSCFCWTKGVDSGWRIGSNHRNCREKENSLRVALSLEVLMQRIAVEGNGVDLEAPDPDCRSNSSSNPESQLCGLLTAWNRQLESTTSQAHASASAKSAIPDSERMETNKARV